jgi:hypothetical protein
VARLLTTSPSATTGSATRDTSWKANFRPDPGRLLDGVVARNGADGERVHLDVSRSHC